MTLTDKQEDTFHSRPAVRIRMPDRLKSVLVDDWEEVTKNQKVTPLPAYYSVSFIIDEWTAYEKSKRRKGSAEADILDEIAHGLKLYFNRALGRCLLYRFERDQYLNVHNAVNSPNHDLAGKDFSDFYSGVMLLRLMSMY
jgi:mortality factor 4-like protein 1